MVFYTGQCWLVQHQTATNFCGQPLDSPVEDPCVTQIALVFPAIAASELTNRRPLCLTDSSSFPTAIAA
ncbi:hypothetical protein RRG08_065420 [Elysia crispata]|uniref:Uncharacterized protein n=1 Tax=Elysia crispata TaxID=231223 RepID=A0AAE1DNJ7_9GAST|nr:hypothetical protein RRG08_065420 [Elysia crispata]